MSPLLCFQVLILTISTATQIVAYQDAVSSVCLGNVLRVSVDASILAGKSARVDALNGSDVIPITPFLATQCGYSMTSDPWGNTLLYASLQHCYVQSRGDGTFDTHLQLTTYGKDSGRVHTVSQSCSYSQLAFREILCTNNYMEVSVEHGLPTSEQLKRMTSSVKDVTSSESVPEGMKVHKLEKVVIYTPAEKAFTPMELHRLGYGLYTYPVRLLIRSPYDTTATYSQDVAGVPMAIMTSSLVYKHRWMVSLVKAAAACPTGGVSFTEDLISWRLPRHITPLLSSSSCETLEAYMGIDGQRLDEATMIAQGYSFYVTDTHFVVEVPIGSPYGYYKSHVHEGRYHTTYSIVPMIELLWREMGGSDETRYKVLFPISTPPIPRPPHVQNYTVPEEGMFKIVFGTFLPDVELINITTDSAVMTLAEATANGFDIQEHVFPNGSKAFRLQVPFSHPTAVKGNPNVKTTTYGLHIVFGFLIQPEQTTFSYSSVLEAAVDDTDLASVTGSCDQMNVYITVQYGSQGHNFETVVGGSLLTAELAQQYSFNENGTHFTLTLPFGSPDIAIEAVHSSNVKGRLDVALQNPERTSIITYFSLACSFIISILDCSPNGTIGALAVKLDTVPSLNPGQLSLNDPSCGPSFSDDRFAFFYFRVDTCGTTRAFKDDVMVYENMASLKNDQNIKTQSTTNEEPKYQFVFSCIYSVNATKAYSTMPQSTAPVAEAGVGAFTVQMSLAQVLPVITGTCDDESYYVTVAYGSHGSDFKTIVGKRELTSDLATKYNVRENATHMTMSVPFLSSDAVFTFVLSSAAGGRLDLKVIDPLNNWSLNNFSLACTFPMPLTECHPNGTMIVLALKVESVPNLILSQLTLKDPSCKPMFSSDQFASFSFPVNSCGTTRTFLDGFMVYQNEITMSKQGGVKNVKTTSHPEYRLTISCYYENDDFKMLQFLPEDRSFDRPPQPAFGEMRVRMRLATDVSYNTFYTEEDYPVVEALRRPLYFEVELLESTDPQLVLFLESCWATLEKERLSTPRWDIIVDGCANHDDRYLPSIHPVTADGRVQFPSHFKRFDMKMFAFVQDNVVLKDQIFIHCDTAICDDNKQSDGLCYRRCPSSPENVNELSSVKSSQSSAKYSPKSRAQLSSGRIMLSS
ncbi:uncharacterized protein LOC105908976 isoform X2 [Clupea harengus]|uniref:Uncharacterized protein LOC105908976 isoform X2 n=1 Tax=Clupea harengus TaxID=7950 RepID=A0A6P8GEK1_CLUHA|nr:uncharacterized protein LOC105908976 isoform X2 [Clupea harengus]